jgi:hypothetical protein
MLAYTFNNLLTEQAVVQRDISSADGYGSTTGPNWQYLSTIPCRLWWLRSEGIRSANRRWVTPARDVPMDEGGLLVPLDTDITELDRITAINVYNSQTGTWLPYAAGNYTITAVLKEEDHMEIDVSRAFLGA